ncbi:MAG: PspA-associated protein PspAB [Acidimicrobiales bacterium]
MGLFDALLGRTKPVRPNLDALFALPSAAVTLQTAAGLVVAPRAGVCWKPPAGRPAEDVRREIAELLSIPDDDAATPQTPTPQDVGTGDVGTGDGGGANQLTQAEDSYGYRWLLLEDPEVDDLVTRVHLINSTLSDNGWGPQLLCSVFGLTPTADADPDTKALFLIYLFKRGTFYPFAPDGPEHRDSELELRIRAVLGADLPVEADLTRWFPLWDMPLR